MEEKFVGYDIIIQAGQSNAEGTGVGEMENPYIPNDKVYYLTAKKKVAHTPERVVIEFFDEPFVLEVAQERGAGASRVGDFSLYFARDYIEKGFLRDGRKLLIIRAGVGGTGFKKGNWGVNALLYNKLIEMTDYALSLGSENRVVAFLWHQGEHDAFEKNEPKIFETQLFEMVSEIRKRYGNMPFIAGDFVREWKQKYIELCAPIVEKMKTVVERLQNAGFVETEDLLSNNEKTGNGDDIHFCRDALRILGERYLEEYIALKRE